MRDRSGEGVPALDSVSPLLVSFPPDEVTKEVRSETVSVLMDIGPSQWTEEHS